MEQFWKVYQKENSPAFPAMRRCEDWLGELGGLRDTTAGWRKYQEYLVVLNELDPKRKEELFGKICRGWVLGTREYRKVLHADFKRMQVARDWGGEALRELNEMEWEEMAAHCLGRLGKSVGDVAGDLKSAEWKAAIAWWMKANASVNNRWLSERLNMGAPAMVSRLAGAFGRKSARVRRGYEKRFIRKG